MIDKSNHSASQLFLLLIKLNNGLILAKNNMMLQNGLSKAPPQSKSRKHKQKSKKVLLKTVIR
jgi:hypothetical protein